MVKKSDKNPGFVAASLGLNCLSFFCLFIFATPWLSLLFLS